MREHREEKEETDRLIRDVEEWLGENSASDSVHDFDWGDPNQPPAVGNPPEAPLPNLRGFVIALKYCRQRGLAILLGVGLASGGISHAIVWGVGIRLVDGLNICLVGADALFVSPGL